MFRNLREKRRQAAIAADLYSALVAQARQPVFYRDCEVPDTMLGRFEMVCLHAFLTFRRLAQEGSAGTDLSQAVHDRMFADFDLTLREEGIGDMGIGKRIKKLARNLYGRIAAYEEGLAAGDEVLAAALRRNLYAGEEVSGDGVSAVMAYMRACLVALEAQSGEALTAGQIEFANPAACVPARAAARESA